MKNSFGLFLVVFALFSLWAYNSGRATAIINIIKTPPGQPIPAQSGTQPGGISSQPTLQIPTNSQIGASAPGGGLAGLLDPIAAIAGIFG